MVFPDGFRYNSNMERYLYFFAVFAVFLLSLLAQSHVQRVFQKYAQEHARSGVPACRLAEELLNRHGLSLRVERVSEAVYDSDSVSALAVAAHEIGHVLQHQEDYAPMRMRSVILPVANIGCRFGPLLVIGGLLLSAISSRTGNVGYYIAMGGVVLYAVMLLFQVITLPVEFNASRRGLSMLTEGGYLSEEELPGAKKMLRAAALTYLLAALGSLITVFRLFSIAQGARRRS